MAMSDTVTCSVCGEDVGRRGIGTHAGKHKREFKEAVGRPAEDYEEVREWADGNLPGDVATLERYTTETDR